MRAACLVILFFLFIPKHSSAQDTATIRTASDEPAIGVRIEYQERLWPEREKHGSYNLYFNDVLLQKGNYQNGLRDGSWTFYNNHSIPTASGNYKNGKMDGEWKFYYRNGTFASAITFNDGERNGPATGYYDNGQKATERSYKDNHHYGKYIIWDKHGVKAEEFNYGDNGKMHGIQKEWYRNGVPKSEFYMVHNIVDSIYKSYHPNGKPSEELIYKQGVVWNVKLLNDSSGNPLDPGTLKNGTGVYKSYNSEGDLEQEVTYKNGKKHGPASLYLGGKVSKTGNYQNDVREGIWKQYNIQGKITKINNWKEGKLSGYETEYWPGTNSKKAEGGYVDDEREGAWTAWDEDGNRVYEVIYAKGMLHGSAKFYYDGKLIKEGEYADNEKTGSWKYYDINGQEITEAEFNVSSLSRKILYPPRKTKTTYDPTSVPRGSTTSLPSRSELGEVSPEFPGDLARFLAKNIVYPAEARDSGITGTVYIEFTIGITGEPEKFKVLKELPMGCTEAAMKVVQSMPNWTIGFLRGLPVSVSHNLPLRFKLKN
jgi:antitoxin component YwqK of YwqJK toxin-antitoxin module